MRDAGPGVGPQALGDVLGRPLERRRAGLRVVALDAPGAAGPAHEDGDGALDLGGVAPDVARTRSSTISRRRGMPSGRLPMSANHEFQASACGIVIRSIRGPVRPDEQGRAARSRPARQQLAVAGLVEAPVEVDGALAAGASG